MTNSNPYATPVSDSSTSSPAFAFPESAVKRQTFGNVVSWISIVCSIALVGGLLVYQLFFNDEWDQLLEVMLGCVGLGAILFVAWYDKHRQKKLTAHVAAGIELTNEEQWKAALSEFDSALSIGNEVHAQYGRGLCFLALQKFDPAAKALDEAIALGVNDMATLRLRARALMELCEFDRALTEFHQLLEREPLDSDVICGRGFVYLKLGQLEKSIQDSTSAIALNPQEATAYNNRGVALLELGRIDEAIVDLEKALEIDPEFANPQRHLARAREMSVAKAVKCTESA